MKKKNYDSKEISFNDYVDKINKDNFKYYAKFLDLNILSWGLIKQYNDALTLFIHFLVVHEEKMSAQGFLELQPQFREFYSRYVGVLKDLSRNLEVLKESFLVSDLGTVLRLDIKKSLEDNKLCFGHVLSYIERLNNSSDEIRKAISEEDARGERPARQTLER